jgi:hypothetical protein
MGWKEDLLERLREDRARTQQGLEWLRSGTLDVGEVSASGWKTSRRQETIELYERTVRDLDSVMADLEREVG